MKLFITGGSGYLGAALIKHAAPAWDVAASYLTHPIESDRVTALRLDVRDPAAVQRTIELLRPDMVIHTVALPSGAEMPATNVEGTRHIARATAAAGVRLVHLSSDVIFDGEHAPYDESAAPDPISSYGRSKALAEAAVAAENPLTAEHPLTAENPRAAIVRTSLIYGLDPLDPRTRQVLNGEMPRLFTDEYRCPVSVDDLARGLLELAALDYAGVLNITGPQRVSRYEFGIKLANAFHVQPRFTPAQSAPVVMVPGASAERRPRDCTLTIDRAARLLKTRLRSVDEVLATSP